MTEVATSSDLYLEFEPGEVLVADRFEDVNAGMYPCYYTVRDGTLLVSTNVVSLIEELGDLRENPDFNPPTYSLDETPSAISQAKQTVYDVIEESPIGPPLQKLKRTVESGIDERTPDEQPTRWYECWESIDTRISKVRPFESVTPDGTTRTFSPEPSITDERELVETTAELLTEYIHEIEREYPDATHVMCLGGRDSELMALVPKLTDDWYAFSSEPNLPLNEAFIEDNGVDVNGVIGHDNENRESLAEFRRKIRCSDLHCSPAHLRWLPTMEEIAERFSGDCIFWSGTEADTFYSHHAGFDTDSASEFFELQFTRAVSWQGTAHQAHKNFTDAPLVSPYHSERIWRELYQRFDPSILDEGTDLRPAIGRELTGREIVWPDSNPGPDPWAYSEKFRDLDLKSVYLNEIEQRLSTD